MATRSLESHGRFFAPFLSANHDVLDLGCGPGTISVDIARLVAPGKGTGIDYSESQVVQARKHAEEAGVSNVDFQIGSCYELPFTEQSFDRIFCHALMEHLADPVAALREAFHKLKMDGMLGVCSPDSDGWLLSPPSAELEGAVTAYADLQQANGGNLRIGKNLGVLLQDAGFTEIHLAARYECYPSLEFIGEYLALQLEKKGFSRHATTLRRWAKDPSGMFAQAWVSAVAKKSQ
ncbi:class I SAM-dependent methyltransferase [Candidatus Nitrospira allomarina]|uniref:Class I SAM-dependent methyltransferase n=1 Tax=Candidatus Nitrospira allomarina TaxID=3020900 RepID=A0AA96G8J7_9BACT|nr:class I SAM-dependent methyltransferase [Candidatus Nitrospira allomarina]WNM56377.1 class I SAM-dependent methyltransferase [Candidatus Nitrospira allomarina]